MEDAIVFKGLEPLSDHVIRLVGSGIEIFGVLIIVTGIAWSTYLHLRRPMPGEDVEVYKIRIGRSLLLGLEVLVAADIVKTIAHELTFISPACSPASCWCAPFSAGHWSWKSRVVGRGSENHHLCHRELGLDGFLNRADTLRSGLSSTIRIRGVAIPATKTDPLCEEVRTLATDISEVT
jgi:hypothetical protein